MKRWHVAVPAFVILLSGVGYAAELRPAVAQGANPLLQMLAAVSCSSINPCQTYTNSSSGAGVQGVSSAGSGTVGKTKFNSTSSSNGKAGVLGQDLSTSGAFDAGVSGTSVRGIGVTGSSKSNSGVQGITSTISSFVGGVSGSATSATGVAGRATTGIGVLGTGHVAVEGSDNNSGGDNILANGTGGILFRGNNSASTDVFVVDDAGNTTIGGNTAVGGNTAIGGTASVSGNLLVSGSSAFNDVTADDRIQVVDPPSGAFYEGFSGGTLLFQVDSAGNVHAHSFTADLPAQKTSSGPPLAAYVSEATTPNLENFGEATLQSGSAYVRLDPHFSAAIARDSPYLVFITPQGPTRSSLYVTQKTPYGFQVRENAPGQETVAFDYRIVAKPYAGSAPSRVVPESYRPHVPTFHKLILRKTHEPKPGR